ncbi:MAG: cysteine--1-D-myo-inosityl 2-amino-2-deoxy-alpha-D-glucopyranoside ligase [Streptosporangiaceae bacterium]
MDSWRDTAVPELPGRGPQTMIWDTASGGLAAAASGPRATLYACGITPYDATHIGHAATYVAWDLLVRAWRDAGHAVTYVQNVTDVDDPLLERARATGADWRELADAQIELFRSDMEALRVLPPAHYVGAVEALGIIGQLNRRLADRGALYELDSDVYFARAADPRFGSVSGLDPATMTKLAAERGGDPDRPGKKDSLDPLVWLARRPGEPAWDSEFGPGRPGWHIECAAIATHYLGSAFDVQAGGSDLIFPHHEMSASHARVALGNGAEVFARRYAHAGMIRLDDEKMSKSLGNLVFVSRLIAGGADPMAVRLAVLAHHYRSDWDWTDEGLAAARRRLQRWRAAVAAAAAGTPAPPAAPVLTAVRERLASDLDAPGALGALDQWAAAVLTAAHPGQHSGSGPTSPRPASPGPAGAFLSADGAAEQPADAARLIRATADALLGIAL